MRWPTQDELNAGYAAQVTADALRARAVYGIPKPLVLVEKIALGEDPAAVAPLGEVKEVPLLPEPAILPIPTVDPMVFCEECGRVFQYKGQARDKAMSQLGRHQRKDHKGQGWDDRGAHPKRRAKAIGATMKARWQDPAFRAKQQAAREAFKARKARSEAHEAPPEP